MLRKLSLTCLVLLFALAIMGCESKSNEESAENTDKKTDQAVEETKANH